jgi:hypothetical protein
VQDQDQVNEAPSLLTVLLSKGVTTDKKDVDRLLIESIDDVLADLLGRQVRETFYDFLERNYYIGREEIPRRLSDFLLILERTFGKSGKTIERTLAKRLCTQLG